MEESSLQPLRSSMTAPGQSASIAWKSESLGRDDERFPMSDAIRKRRKRKPQSNSQLTVVVGILSGIAILGVVIALAAMYIRSNSTTVAKTGAPTNADERPEVKKEPAAPPPPQSAPNASKQASGSPTPTPEAPKTAPEAPKIAADAANIKLEDIVYSAYGYRTMVLPIQSKGRPLPINWETTTNGKSFQAPSGGRFSVDITGGRATILFEEAFDEKPRDITSLKVQNFLALTIPHYLNGERPIGSAHDDLRDLYYSMEKIMASYLSSWNSMDAKSHGTFRGKVIEATIDYKFDSTSKKAIFQLEMKKIGS